MMQTEEGVSDILGGPEGWGMSPQIPPVLTKNLGRTQLKTLYGETTVAATLANVGGCSTILA